MVRHSTSCCCAKHTRANFIAAHFTSHANITGSRVTMAHLPYSTPQTRRELAVQRSFRDARSVACQLRFSKAFAIHERCWKQTSIRNLPHRQIIARKTSRLPGATCWSGFLSMRKVRLCCSEPAWGLLLIFLATARSLSLRHRLCLLHFPSVRNCCRRSSELHQDVRGQSGV